jgi:hypothetical protein
MASVHGVVFFFVEDMDVKKVRTSWWMFGIACILLATPIRACAADRSSTQRWPTFSGSYAIVAFGEIVPLLFNNSPSVSDVPGSPCCCPNPSYLWMAIINRWRVDDRRCDRHRQADVPGAAAK